MHTGSAVGSWGDPGFAVPTPAPTGPAVWSLWTTRVGYYMFSKLYIYIFPLSDEWIEGLHQECARVMNRRLIALNSEVAKSYAYAQLKTSQYIHMKSPDCGEKSWPYNLSMIAGLLSLAKGM